MGIYLGSALPDNLTAPTLPIEKIKAMMGARLSHFWLADKATTIGGAFAWPDEMTGIAMTRTQSTLSPTKTTDGGLPAVLMANAGMYVNQTLGFVGADGYTFMFIQKPPALTGQRGLLGFPTGETSKMYIRKNNPATSEIQVSNSGSASKASGSGYSTNGVYASTLIAWDDAANEVTFGVNGVLGAPVAETDAIVAATAPVFYATDQTTTGAMAGLLSRAILVFNEDMTRGANAIDLARLDAIISAVYGI